MQRMRGVSDESASSSRKSSVVSRKSSIRATLDRLRRRTTSLLSRSLSGDDDTIRVYDGESKFQLAVHCFLIVEVPAPRAASRSFDSESVSYQNLPPSITAPLPSLSELITSALEGADGEISPSSNQSNCDVTASNAVVNGEGSMGV